MGACYDMTCLGCLSSFCAKVICAALSEDFLGHNFQPVSPAHDVGYCYTCCIFCGLSVCLCMCWAHQ